MEDLPTAVLAGLTPVGVETAFFDERLEPIDFDAPTELAAIHVEAYTAKRAYEIAAEYHRRGVPTILGGYHPTLVASEASRYAESVLVGHAEGIWEQVIDDARRGTLRPRYQRGASLPMRFGMPRRSIFGSRDYLKVACVETGRGCPHRCDFCSIMQSTDSHYYPRPIEEILEDISQVHHRNVFLIDDNIIGNLSWAKELFRRLAPYRIRWFSQGTLNMARDPELLELMAASGCVGLLIGFESFNRRTLEAMGKRLNLPYVGKFQEAIQQIHRYGICLYGSFIFGYDHDTNADFQETIRIAVDAGLFMAAFNPLIPFPGTPLHQRLLAEGRLPDPRWHLSPTFRFNDIPFRPLTMTAQQLRDECLEARHQFYRWSGIVRRMSNVRGNLNSPAKAAAYLYINGRLRSEIDEKDGLPLGNEPQRPEPIYGQR